MRYHRLDVGISRMIPWPCAGVLACLLVTIACGWSEDSYAIGVAALAKGDYLAAKAALTAAEGQLSDGKEVDSARSIGIEKYLGHCDYYLGRFDDSLSHFQKAMAAIGSLPPDSPLAIGTKEAYGTMCIAFGDEGRAMELLTSVQEHYQRAEDWENSAKIGTNLGPLMHIMGKSEQCIADVDHALESLLKAYPAANVDARTRLNGYLADNVETIFALFADALQFNNANKEALDSARDAFLRHYHLVLLDVGLAFDNQEISDESADKAIFHFVRGDFAGAEAVQLSWIEKVEKEYSFFHPDLAIAYSRLSAFFRAEGRNGLALACLQHALDIQQRIPLHLGYLRASVEVRLGAAYETVSAPELAIASYENAVAFYSKKDWSRNSIFFDWALHRLVILYVAAGKPDDSKRIRTMQEAK
jgi:tetratricopeptide (TPR) repeat protein